MPITAAPASFRSKKGGWNTPSRPRAHRDRGLRHLVLTKDKGLVAQETNDTTKKRAAPEEAALVS